jgi:hypothetical protein
MKTIVKNRKKYNDFALYPALLSLIMGVTGHYVSAIALFVVAFYIGTCSPFDSTASGFKSR